MHDEAYAQGNKDPASLCCPDICILQDTIIVDL
jgi:hypothetical protein